MDKKRLARIVKEEVQNLFEMRGRRRPAAPFGYGMGPYDSTKGKPEIDPFEAGTGDYRPRRPAGPPSLMGAGLSRTQGELFVIPRTGLLNIRLYPDNLDAVGGAVESKLFQMPEGITVRIVNFKNQSEVEGTLEVKSVSEEGRNVLKGYEAKIKMGGTEFFGEGQRAADAIAAADDARAAASAGGAEMGPGSMEPMSESRWGRLAGLMTEAKSEYYGTGPDPQQVKIIIDDEGPTAFYEAPMSFSLPTDDPVPGSLNPRLDAFYDALKSGILKRIKRTEAKEMLRAGADVETLAGGGREEAESYFHYHGRKDR